MMKSMFEFAGALFGVVKDEKVPATQIQVKVDDRHAGLVNVVGVEITTQKGPHGEDVRVVVIHTEAS